MEKGKIIPTYSLCSFTQSIKQMQTGKLLAVLTRSLIQMQYVILNNLLSQDLQLLLPEDASQKICINLGSRVKLTKFAGGEADGPSAVKTIFKCLQSDICKEKKKKKSMSSR